MIMTRLEAGIAILAVVLGVSVWFSLSKDTPRAVDPPSLAQPVQPLAANGWWSPIELPPAETAGPPAAANLPPTSYPATAAEQHAKDSLAEPGDWVTPPAYSKSE